MKGASMEKGSLKEVSRKSRFLSIGALSAMHSIRLLLLGNDLKRLQKLQARLDNYRNQAFSWTASKSKTIREYGRQGITNTLKHMLQK